MGKSKSSLNVSQFNKKKKKKKSIQNKSRTAYINKLHQDEFLQQIRQ
jgi:hypothetical protein